MKWFEGCTTTADVKKLFRELAMQHHPDRGGSTEKMQQINAAYLEALRHMDGQSETGKTNEGESYTYTYTYKEEVEQSVIDKMGEVLRSGLLDAGDLEVWLIGSWLWITGETKAHRHEIKELSFRFHGKRQAWYWHDGEYRRRYNSRVSLAELASRYGASKVANEDDKRQIAVG